MNIKPKMQPELLAALGEDENQRDAVDAFILRNRDALNESIRSGREQLARGDIPTVTIDDIIAAGRKRHGG